MIQRGEENVFGRNIIGHRVTILYSVHCPKKYKFPRYNMKCRRLVIPSTAFYPQLGQIVIPSTAFYPQLGQLVIPSTAFYPQLGQFN